MENNNVPAGFEPNEWNLVFHLKAANRWFSMIAMGKYKHVSAYAYVPGHKVWIIYDAQWTGTRVSIVTHEAMVAYGGRIFQDCDIINGVRKIYRPMPWWTRLGFTCVTASKHLTGLACIAMRPDAFHRFVLKHQEKSVEGRAPSPSG